MAHWGIRIGGILAILASDTAYADIAAPIVPVIPNIPDTPTAVSQQNYTQLFLLVYLNHTDTAQVTPFYQDSHGRLFVYPKDLRVLRIKVPNNDNKLIALDTIQGITYHYDETRQEMALQLPDTALNSYLVELNSQKTLTDTLLKSKPLTAAILNYAIYDSNTNGKNTVTGSFETLLNHRWGNFSSGFLVNSETNTNNNANNNANKVVRLQSNWQYIDPVKIRSYVVGDFVSNTSEWGNSVRLAGLQWSSAYTQRADIVTAALPQFSGSAALPSSLDLFVNQQKIYSGQVPSGPFDVKSLPFISGNEVTLITKDATGQQFRTTQHYYYSPKILAQGIHEFSVDIGIPRYNYGIESNQYDNTLFGSGSLRYGINNTLTASGNVESSSDGLVNVGAGFAKNLAGRGIINADIATSHYKDQTGALSLIGLEGNIAKKLSFNTSYQRTFNNYYDLARVSNVRFSQQINAKIDNNVNSNNVNYLTYSALANEIIKTGLNWNIKPSYTLSLNYNKIKYPTTTSETTSLNLGGALSKNLSFYASAFKDMQDRRNYGGYVALQYRPTQNYVTTTSYTNNSGHATYRQDISHATTGIGSLGWGASIAHSEADIDKNLNATAYVNYRTHPANLMAQYSRFGDNNQAVVSAQGALIATGGKVFAANAIGNAYALVENAGPGSHILNGGVDLGVTDRQGRFFISDLTPYSQHHIYLDPAHLGLDWQPTNTEQLVISGYRQGTKIDFGTHKAISATITALDSQHQPIAAGYAVTLNAKKEAALVGYDGEIYLTDIQPQNNLTIDLLDKGSCTINFAYTQKTSATTKLGPFVCQ